MAEPLLAPMDRFAQCMGALPIRHPRRSGLLLGQAGLLVTAVCFCISIAVVLLTVVLSILYGTQPGRFQRLLEMKGGRWPIWQTTIHLVGERPWLGTGGNDGCRAAYVEAYPQVVHEIPNEFPKGAPHAHNTQSAHVVEHGIPFAIAWLVLLLVPLAALWRAQVDSPTIWRAAIGMGAMVLIFGQFEKLDGEASRVLWTGLGMLLALAGAQNSSGNGLVALGAENLGPSGTGNAQVKEVGP